MDLHELLQDLLPQVRADECVLVSPATADDAGVYRVGDLTLVATVDLITPVCDDPRRFGRVAVANAVSDVFAMGGSVLFGLNICCFPESDAPSTVYTELLAGGLEKLTEAGGALLGGHSIRDVELKYGLAAVGRVDPERMLTNAGARPGHQLVLTKALGTGAIINGYRSGALGDAELEPVLGGMERLNDRASEVAVQLDATFCTDVSGYGLAGHALEVASASGVGLSLRAASLPAYPGFDSMCEAGIATRGARQNARAAADRIQIDSDLAPRERALLFDPQTSGGLLLGIEAERLDALLEGLGEHGEDAVRIGEVISGGPRLVIE